MGLPEPVFQTHQVTIYQGDAFALLPLLEPASAQLIIADPPYYKAKLDYLGEKLTWDRQWPTREAYLDWLRQLAKEWQRILAPNGSLYVFASPQMAAWVEVALSETFSILQRLTWRKPPFATKAEMFEKDKLRMFFPASEAIIFAEHLYSDAMALGESGYAAQCEQLHGHVFEPIRAYLDGERRRAGIDKAACNAACGFAAIPGGMASRHYFSQSQWQLPTKDHYAALQHLFNTQGRHPAPPFTEYHPMGSPFATFHFTDYEYLRTDYEALRTDYEALRTDYEALRTDYEALRTDYEALRRPFTVTKDVSYTDVFDYATVPYHQLKHPAQKPLSLLRHLITASSRPGDLVLDPMAGSFATCEAARQTGRRSIGIEQDPVWCARGASDLKQELLF
jgi:adenine-specific DNA-methyltransferase